MATPAELATRVREGAQALGFARIGFTPVEPLTRGEQALGDWLERDHHGEMTYMATQGPRGDARALLPEARTIVVVALAYDRSPLPIVSNRPRGVVARYARGEDYHIVLKQKLHTLADQLSQICERPVLARACVDTAPLLEREAAHRAGVGFIAKSTMVIAPGLGTYFLLGELLVDVDIAPDAPADSKCGRCTACIDACPTGAIRDAFVVDARRCVSYLTIETKGPIPRELRASLGAMIFGCDICQDVCPFNASPAPRPSAPELRARPSLVAPELETLLDIGAAQFRKLVRRSALRRIGRAQLMRNAAVALGNSGDLRVVPKLVAALEGHQSPLVREHVAWALGRLGGDDARAALHRASASDDDPSVRQEAARSLADLAQRQSSSTMTGA